MYQLLIADDEPLVQAGIQSMLNWKELNIELCPIAMNGEAALKIIEEKRPDIVITDIKMPVMSGLELIKFCRERYGTQFPAFIILTSYEEFQLAKEALSYQVIDYLVKLELTPEALKASVNKAIAQIKQTSGPVNDQESHAALALGSFYDKFFIRLLHNLFDSQEQFLIQSRDLQLDFHYSYYSVIYMETTGNMSHMDISKQIALYNSTLQILKDILAKYLFAHVVTLDMHHTVLIFCFPEEPENGFENFITYVLENASKTLHNYYNVSFLFGIGSPVNTAERISESFQSARQAFSYADSSRPICISENFKTEKSKNHMFNLSLFKENLSKAYEEFDSNILYETLTQIGELFTGHPSHYVQVLDATCSILYLSMSFLPDGSEMISDIFREDPDGYRSIYRQREVKDIVAWLYTFRDGLCSIFDIRKKDYKNHIVSNVKKYIHGHIRERLTLNEIAAIFGITPNYLSQLFKKYSDMGFNEYITHAKIIEAKRFFTESNLRVYEVADLLGFESAFYFSKVFKKVEGMSPTDYLNHISC